MKLKSINIKKLFYVIISMFTVMCLCIMPTYAWGRKLVTKSTSGSFTWSAYRYNYSFNAVAGITYDDNNNITQISDLSFNNVKCISSDATVPGSITPRQSRKYFSGRTATYVVTVLRNAYGFYSDKVDYTFTYRSTDAGTPYSLKDDESILVLVDVIESEPYDIQIQKE